MLNAFQEIIQKDVIRERLAVSIVFALLVALYNQTTAPEHLEYARQVLQVRQMVFVFNVKLMLIVLKKDSDVLMMPV